MVDVTADERRHAGGIIGNISRVNPRRSLILYSAGAIMGLIIAGFGLFTAAGTKISGVPTEEVELINGRHSQRSRFHAHAQSEPVRAYAHAAEAPHQKGWGETSNEELP